jgi:hypothetical protein
MLTYVECENGKITWTSNAPLLIIFFVAPASLISSAWV